MKCIKCGDEYREGFTVCAECNIPLVNDDYTEEEASNVRETIRQQEVNAVSEMSFSDQVTEHLEFMGFKVKKENGYSIASHSRLDPFILTEYEGGIIFETEFKLKEHARENKSLLYEFINKLNNSVPLSRVLYNEQHDTLIIDNYYKSIYEKSDFEHFFKLILADINIIKHDCDFHLFTDEAK